MAHEYTVNQADMVSVADAIREKGQTSERLVFPGGFADAIRAIRTGVELNFEVVGGTEQPSDPEENTIWVDTEREITGWSFGSYEPNDPTEGAIWIVTRDNSKNTINLVSENEIQVSLSNAKQYIGGEWITKNAEIYTLGSWESFLTYLFKNGNLYADVTGGFQLVEWPLTSATTGSDNSTSLTFQDEQMLFTRTYSSSIKYTAAVVSTQNLIDLTGFDTLTVRGTMKVSVDSVSYFRLFVEDSRSTPWANADAGVLTPIAKGTFYEWTLDISGLSGSFYIGIGMYALKTTDYVNVAIDEICLS